LIVVVLAILFLLLRRGRAAGGTAAVSDYVSEAYLNDKHGYTSQNSYKLGNKPTMLGRVAGTDTEYLDFIVIPQSTIGRRHSLIEYKDYAYWIVDQGSINGTFVNDVPITSEVRLKHGDRIRLHKYEFEFVMPEMVDAGRTVVSNTVMAAQTPEASEATEVRGASSRAGNGQDLDFDLSGDAVSPTGEISSGRDDAGHDDLYEGSEDETLMPAGEAHAGHGTSSEEEQDAGDTSDETLMPDSQSEAKTPPRGMPIHSKPKVKRSDDHDMDDETLMPGNFNLPEDDATIRKDADDSQSYENFLDIGSLDNDQDK
jgi:pSer/pThr/pTyr-binding forkhead associated (FHA) protein